MPQYSSSVQINLYFYSRCLDCSTVCMVFICSCSSVSCFFQQNVPMIFLPVHKSHIDYLLITLILFCHNIKAPHIAAGNNLSIPILRWKPFIFISDIWEWYYKDNSNISINSDAKHDWNNYLLQQNMIVILTRENCIIVNPPPASEVRTLDENMITPFGFSFQHSHSQTWWIFHPTKNGGDGRWEEGHFVQVAFACSKSRWFFVSPAQNGSLIRLGVCL